MSIAPEALVVRVIYFSVDSYSLPFDICIENFFTENFFYRKNASQFVGIAPDSISEVIMHFSVALNSLTFNTCIEKNFYGKYTLNMNTVPEAIPTNF